jgi:DNA mismatch endonuclease (patch repair protein)
MSDVLTAEQRSRCMASIRGRNTKPERIVRSTLHRMGYRFRVHRRDLDGKPDIVLTRLHKIVFVHGCFWHMHRCKYGRVVAKTNADFWRAKREGNVARDRRNISALRRAGWDVRVIWECQTRSMDSLTKRLAAMFPPQTRDSNAPS